MLGTKKFSVERFLAIVDYLISLDAENSTEHKNLSRSCDYLACINSLAEEGLLKKTAAKKGEGVAGSDELVQVYYKCNFDSNYAQEIAQKIDFKLDEYVCEAPEI